MAIYPHLRSVAARCASILACALLASSSALHALRVVDRARHGPGIDDAGWTSIDASADTRRVYVSASAGDDDASGLSPSAPKRTIAAGKALLRHGFPDWLLLRRGDTWHESLGQWKKSGRSAEEPMLVMSYGDAPARPLLMTGSG
ncbi:MAG: hypothetical protein ACKVWV_16320, partial [Planctomycetota bacterium]